jgi:hypothetical protein
MPNRTATAVVEPTATPNTVEPGTSVILAYDLVFDFISHDVADGDLFTRLEVTCG